MLTSSDLEKDLGLSQQWIQKQAKEALEAKRPAVKFGERSFGVEMVNGAYVFEELWKEEADAPETDLSRAWLLASEDKQAEAIAKERFIRDYRNRGRNEHWKKFLIRVGHRYKTLKPSKSKLFRWLKIVNECEEKNLVPLEHLLDTRGKAVSNRSYSDEQYAYVENLILENPEVQAVHVQQYMEMDYGKEQMPSYATITRMMTKWKADPKNIMIYTLAMNPSDAVSKLRPAPARADSECMYTNAVWELDGTPADVICDDGIRYSISAAIDVYSRRVVWVLEPSSSAVTLGRMLKKGIEKFGLPEVVLCDQGKEYKSKNFAHTCSRLGIEQKFTPPFSGYMKPHIERFFGTMTRDLFVRINGFIGHNVAHRERLANQKTFSDKKASIKKWNERFKSGDAFAKNFANKKENVGIDIELPISRDELELLMEKWTELYENRNHRGIDMTPMKKWNACAVPRKMISDENVLNILIGQSVKKRITKKGITWNKIVYFNDIFYDMVKQDVWALSNDDLGVIFVYDLDMNFLCKAENYAELGRSRNEHIASLKFDAKLAKQQKKLDEQRANKPERIEKFLDSKNENSIADESIEFAIEQQSASVEHVKKALSNGKNGNDEEEQESKEEEIVLINGRPIFGSLHDRFMWDFEHDSFDESTEKLAKKKPRLYKMAVEEWEERKLA